MKLSLISVAAAALLGAGSMAPTFAALVTYTGEDIMATTTSAHPVSAAAAAFFDAAVGTLGSSTLITFESAPLGSFSNLTIAPGVTLSGTDLLSANQTIRNTPGFPPAPTLDGYNTTAGGSAFVEVFGGTLKFTFATPIQSFGAYFSGIQTAFFADAVMFSDGSSQTVLIPGAGTSNFTGALSFVGFTDAGRSIASITINVGGIPGVGGQDAIGVDDVRIQAAPIAAPEPGSLALLLTACGFLVARRSRQRRRQPRREA